MLSEGMIWVEENSRKLVSYTRLLTLTGEGWLQAAKLLCYFVIRLPPCVTKPSKARAGGSLSGCSHVAAIVVAYINQAVWFQCGGLGGRTQVQDA